jgi:glycosyltransferase involved in cell wall biosynthesis
MTGSRRYRDRRILLITPHLEPTVVELRQLLGGEQSVDIDCSNPIKVQGEKRSPLDRLRYYWLDPLLTMLRLAPHVWRYQLVIAYYHRNGYWLGVLRRLRRRRAGVRWVWIGFAPNPRRRGVLGWIKEHVTYSALLGHDLIVCNARPVIDMVKQRYPKVAERLAYARWGSGGGPMVNEPVDRGYVFCGGRTNRDFATVLAAVAIIRCPTVIVAGQDAELPACLPDHVSIYRDISSDEFQRLVEESRVVVLALKRPDVSSGQVVLSRAMQSGKPVLVTAVAGIEDYVTDGKDAILVAPDDPEDLSAKLAALLDDPERRKRLGLAARLTYEHSFNSRVFARELFEAVTTGVTR